jgi:hypothetical protein
VIGRLNGRLGLALDAENDVELSSNNTTNKVTVIIFLNPDHPSKTTIASLANEGKWYR